MVDSDEWCTPREEWDKLDAEFHFTVDVAADDDNHLCEKYYTKDTDGLKQDWRGEVVWCNPPYSDIGPWVAKAAISSCTTVMLLPPGIDTKWFHDWIWNVKNHCPHWGVQVRFIKGRWKFHHPEQPGKQSPKQGNMIVVFHNG